MKIFWIVLALPVLLSAQKKQVKPTPKSNPYAAYFRFEIPLQTHIKAAKEAGEKPTYLGLQLSTEEYYRKLLTSQGFSIQNLSPSVDRQEQKNQILIQNKYQGEKEIQFPINLHSLFPFVEPKPGKIKFQMTINGGYTAGLSNLFGVESGQMSQEQTRNNVWVKWKPLRISLMGSGNEEMDEYVIQLSDSSRHYELNLFNQKVKMHIVAFDFYNNLSIETRHVNGSDSLTQTDIIERQFKTQMIQTGRTALTLQMDSSNYLTLENGLVKGKNQGKAWLNGEFIFENVPYNSQNCEKLTLNGSQDTLITMKTLCKGVTSQKQLNPSELFEILIQKPLKASSKATN